MIDSFDQLTRRAERFIAAHGIRVECARLAEFRDPWLEFGLPAMQIDRILDFQRRWGGLILPPSADYEGGPAMLSADLVGGALERIGWFEAGPERVSMAYEFMIGPNGEFGIDGDRWVPLHASIEGWIESLALAYHAARWTKQITTIRGAAVDELSLRAFEPVTEIRGLADTWWRGPDSLIAIFAGEAECFSAPNRRVARIYAGLDEWGLRGG